jgi:hypothetical protein
VHWPSNGSDNIRLWPFAVQHAVWLFNRIPNRVTGLTPLEVFTKTKSDHRDLQRAHVWGCPVFVLDPRLQDGKKIPKWNRRARLAQFVGFSSEHSTLVANVRHLQTNYVSPQFHLIHDDNFETILNDTPLDHPLSDERLLDIFETSREIYSDIERSEDGAIVYTPPPLDDIGLMKESDVRSASRLLKSVLVLATVGNLKPSNLQSLSLLFSLLTHYNARLVPWSLMTSLLVLLSLLMMIRLFLLQ